MVTTDVELQLTQQLVEAGKRLAHPPESIDELLHLLDQSERLLGKVDQSPHNLVLEALGPLRSTLVKGNLLTHSNADVNVAVAVCLSEITRITAPDAPYSDEEMKDVFRLIVSSLENLSDTVSRSYAKRASILETVWRVRSCVIMLDLECEELIVEMFQHFLKSVRNHHVGNMFSWMRDIMVLVLEESEDISVGLLKPLLASIKNNSEGVLPVARKLGEGVLLKSAAKLRPYLINTLKILGDSLDDYSRVLASICEGTTNVVKHDDENTLVQRQADESKLTTASSDDASQVVIGKAEGPSPGETDATFNRSVMSNEIMVTRNEEGSADKESSKKSEEAINHPDSNLTSKAHTDHSVTEKLAKVGSNSEQTSNGRGDMSDTTMKSAKPSDSSHGHIDNEAEKLPKNKKSSSKDICSSPGREKTEENTDVLVSAPKARKSYVTNAPSKNSSLPDESDGKKDGLSKQEVLPQQEEAEAANVGSRSQSGSLPYKRRIKRVGRPKKKSLSRDDAPSMDVALTKAPEGMSDSDMKSPKRARKKAPIAQQDKHSATVSTLEDEKATSSPDAELLKTSSKKVDSIDLGSKPIKKFGRKVGAGDSAAKNPNKLSGKKLDVGESEAKKPKQAGKNMDAGDVEGTPSRPSLKKEDGCDSDAKPARQSANNEKRRAIAKPNRYAANEEEGSDSGAKPARHSANNKEKRRAITKPSRYTANKEEGSDSDAEPLILSAKKGKTSGSAMVKSSSKNKDGSDSDAEPLILSAKKGKTSGSAMVKSSSKNKDGKKHGRGKNVEEKDREKSLSEDDGMDVLLSSALKTATVEGSLEEALGTTSKQKRAIDKEKVTKTTKYDDSLVGLKIKVWWPMDKTFYEGVIESFDPNNNRHKVAYVDGEHENLILRKERWEIVQDFGSDNKEKAAEVRSTDVFLEAPKKKRSRLVGPGPSASQGKLKDSAKGSGGASVSGKSKGSASKSAGSLKGEDKVDNKSKDTSIKFKSRKNSGKSVKAATSKEAGMSKEDDEEIITKNKQESLKIVNRSKAKTPESGKKGDANDSSKPKSSSVDVKESEDGDGAESAKRKSVEATKGGSKSGKKRKRRT